MLRILIADDHAIVRAGLKQILAEAPETAFVGEAKDGLQAIHMVVHEDWDIVVLDITMPGANGLDVLRAARRAKPDLPVVILTMHASATYVHAAFRLGAAAFLTKESVPDELLTALRAALVGERYLSRGLSDSLDYRL